MHNLMKDSVRKNIFIICTNLHYHFRFPFFSSLKPRVNKQNVLFLFIVIIKYLSNNKCNLILTVTICDRNLLVAVSHRGVQEAMEIRAHAVVQWSSSDITINVMSEINTMQEQRTMAAQQSLLVKYNTANNRVRFYFHFYNDDHEFGTAVFPRNYDLTGK